MTDNAGNSSDSRFVRIENRLGELGEDMAQLLEWKGRVDLDLYNHGGPTGLKSQFLAFLTEYRTEKTERERQKKFRRWAVGTLAVVFGPALIAFLGWMLMTVIPAAKAILDDYYQHHPTAQVQHSFSNQPDPVVSYERKQDAEIPYTGGNK